MHQFEFDSLGLVNFLYDLSREKNLRIHNILTVSREGVVAPALDQKTAPTGGFGA